MGHISRIKAEYFDAEAYGQTRDEAIDRLIQSAIQWFGGPVQADNVWAGELDTIESDRIRYLDGQIDVAYKAWGTFELLKEDPGPPTARPIGPHTSWER